MTTNFSASAKIYTFPPRGRFAVRGQDEDFATVADGALPRTVKLVSGSGWYHEEAIQEASKEAVKEKSRKN